MNFTIYHSANPYSIESFLERGIVLKKHFNPHTSKEVHGFACTPFFEIAELYAKSKKSLLDNRYGVIFEFFCENMIKNEDFFYVNSFRPKMEDSDIIVLQTHKINLISIWNFNISTKTWNKTLQTEQLIKWIKNTEKQ